jgi:adsorption protein B
MRLRDRSAPLAAAVLAAGYAAILLALIETPFARATGRPAPLLAEIDTPVARLLFLLFVWRLAMRGLLVGRLYGPGEALRSLPRMVVSNLVAIAASARALWTYVANAAPRWDATVHTLPEEIPR